MSITKHLIAACGLALAVSSVNAADAVHHATVLLPRLPEQGEALRKFSR